METKYPAVLLLHNNPDWEKGDKVNIRTKDGKLMKKKFARLCRDHSIGDRLHIPRGLMYEVIMDGKKARKNARTMQRRLDEERRRSKTYRDLLTNIIKGVGCNMTDIRGDKVVILHEGMLEKISKAIEE